MARRASSGISSGVIIGAVAAVGLIIFGGKFLMKQKVSSFGDLAELRVEDVLANGNSLRGNVYVVEGEIDQKLQFSETGQLVSLKVKGEHGDEFIGVEIPEEFNKLNIDTKQKYLFRVKFRDGGIAVATGINRL